MEQKDTSKPNYEVQKNKCVETRLFEDYDYALSERNKERKKNERTKAYSKIKLVAYRGRRLAESDFWRLKFFVPLKVEKEITKKTKKSNKLD